MAWAACRTRAVPKSSGPTQRVVLSGSSQRLTIGAEMGDAGRLEGVGCEPAARSEPTDRSTVVPEV